jgi:putative hemolysin
MSKLVIILLSCAFFLCVLLSAFFSGSEIVYATVNKKKLDREAKAGDKLASKAIAITSRYNEMITTVLVGNNLVNIGASSIATLIAVNTLPESLSPATLSTIIVTFIVLIFGEVIPKTIFPKFGDTLCKKWVFPLRFFHILFYPVVWVVTKFVSLLAKLWTPHTKDPIATGDELITMTEELEENGMIDSDDEELIKSAIEFTDASAYEIMIPRVDMKTMDIEDDPNELFHQTELMTYSRIPVYSETVDHIIGILSTSTLMKLKLNHQKIEVKNLLSQPVFVHRTMPISKVLHELKSSHAHVAIVLDEFGGVDGMVTMEDILEELVGDIWDESDEIVEEYQKVSENVYRVDGDMNIYDFFDLVGREEKDFENEYSTVGGWCTDILDKFPQVQDTFEDNNLTIKILDTEGRRVGHVLVTVHPMEEEDGE